MDGQEAVGQFNRPRQAIAGERALHTCEGYGARYIGTYRKSTGPAYFPSGSDLGATMLDLCFAPSELRVYDLQLVWKTGRKLQLIPHRDPRDHLPILMSFRYAVLLAALRGQGTRFRSDFNALAACLQS